MKRRTLSILIVAFSCSLRAAGWGADGPKVCIVVIDGLDASSLNEQLTPTLWGLAHGKAERTTFYPDGRAVMPAVTNTNHVAVITGAYPAAHGIIGNSTWDREPAHPPAGNDHAALLDIETLFTVVESERPTLTTAALFGKARLANLFVDVPEQQRRPDVLWADLTADSEAVGKCPGLTSDQRTMRKVVRTIAAHGPDLLFVSLSDVDRTSHAFGPDSPQARAALLEADRQIARLIGVLKNRVLWDRTVLMITSDHGFVSVRPSLSAGRLYPMILFGRELLRAGFTDVAALASGGVETIWLPGEPRRALGKDEGQRLAAIRALALAQPEIAEAWYRLPNAADGGDAFTVKRTHPEWRLDHPRAGELLLVARPGHHFNDPFNPYSAVHLGHHGGPDATRIPILITGGEPRVRAQVVSAGDTVSRAANPDLGVTAAWLLGVRMPRGVDGEPVAEELTGRVLREAFE